MILSLVDIMSLSNILSESRNTDLVNKHKIVLSTDAGADLPLLYLFFNTRQDWLKQEEYFKDKVKKDYQSIYTISFIDGEDTLFSSYRISEEFITRFVTEFSSTTLEDLLKESLSNRSDLVYIKPTLVYP